MISRSGPKAPQREKRQHELTDLKQCVTQKAERYKFTGASDEEKSELLKDLLAVAKRPPIGTALATCCWGLRSARLSLQRPRAWGRTVP
jgi:hypothetical protein